MLRFCSFCLLSLAVCFLSSPFFSASPVQDPPGENVLWTDPGDPSTVDFKYGIGGPDQQPQPPFKFVDEDKSGTAPKVNVMDARGVAWNVKWRHEARPSVFATRLVWAMGYFVETEYFVPKGRIEGVPHELGRASAFVKRDGSFANARFQKRTGPPKFMKDHHWDWTSNPFVGTHELNGMKILMMLLSNWDAKSANLSIFEDDRNGMHRYIYADDDWGSSLGKWGGRLTWSKWDCKGYAEQTRDFIKGVEGGRIHWGYGGKLEKDITENVTVADVQWLLQYLGKISDEQIRQGLEASGATPKEIACYSQALRQRIQMLEEVAATEPVGPTDRISAVPEKATPSQAR
jgi:hypothetical protein